MAKKPAGKNSENGFFIKPKPNNFLKLVNGGF